MLPTGGTHALLLHRFQVEYQEMTPEVGEIQELLVVDLHRLHLQGPVYLSLAKISLSFMMW